MVGVAEDVFERADEAAAADGEPLILDPHRNLVVEVLPLATHGVAINERLHRLVLRADDVEVA